MGLSVRLSGWLLAAFEGLERYQTAAWVKKLEERMDSVFSQSQRANSHKEKMN